jgi:multisubunit Na+/H+ antiporter MnhC subunit
MLPFLLVATVIFGVASWLIADANVKKVCLYLCIICAVGFGVILLLSLAGVSTLDYGWPWHRAAP